MSYPSALFGPDPLLALQTPLRLAASALFLLSAAPKLLGWGRAPPHALVERIKARRASWFELEVVAAAHVWDKEFKLPASPLAMQVFGVCVVAAVMALNLSPPPARIGVGAALLLLAVLGAGLHTWLFIYRAVQPAAVAVFAAACLVLSLHGMFSEWYLLFLVCAGPLYLGFLAGSAVTVYCLNYGKLLLGPAKRRRRGFL